MSLAVASRLAAFLALHTINYTYSRHSVNLKSFFKIMFHSVALRPAVFEWENTSNWQLTALICISFAYYTSLHIINCVVVYNFFSIWIWNFIKKDLKTKLGCKPGRAKKKKKVKKKEHQEFILKNRREGNIVAYSHFFAHLFLYPLWVCLQAVAGENWGWGL